MLSQGIIHSITLKENFSRPCVGYRANTAKNAQQNVESELQENNLKQFAKKISEIFFFKIKCFHRELFTVSPSIKTPPDPVSDIVANTAKNARKKC